MVNYLDVTKRASMSSRRLVLCLGLCLVVLMPSTALATPITFNAFGTVDFVDSALSGTFSVGDTLSLTYTFESTTAPRAGSNSSFAVFDALTSLNLFVGSYAASSPAAPEIQVDNNPSAPNDRYGVVSRASDGLAGSAVAGNNLNWFFFRLDDSSNSVFSDALVLPTSLSLGDFDSTNFGLFFINPRTNNLHSVSGQITDLAAPIPEPGTLLLLGTGLAGFAAWRLRKRT